MAGQLDEVGGWMAGAGAGAMRAVAAIAGAFLVWRGAFARRRGGLLPLLAGAFVLRRAFPGAGREKGRRAPEVVEVKSPAELEPGIVSASPTPTFPSRVDRGDDLAR
jgi:hypothetical protein